MPTLTFREWTTRTQVPLTSAQRDALRVRLKATVQPSPGGEGLYDVTPGNTVGAIQVGDATLLVEPKIAISQVLFLLGYTADPAGWEPSAAELDASAGLVAGVTALFTTVCDRALRRGLLTGYHSVETDLTTVRGRIDLAEQLRRRPGLDLPLAVRYTEHDDDIVENQLLLAAATRLTGLPVHAAATRHRLHRILDSLQTVTAVHFPPSRVPEVTWNRLNAHYRPAVDLARLLLRLRSPDLQAGGTRTADLTLDLAALFEEFVRTALREALGVPSAVFPSGDECPPLALDYARKVRLKPDLSFWRRGRCSFVGDVKYKRDPGPGRSADLYQLLAYATATELPEALLIYAHGPEEPHTHQVRHADIQLRISHLDLAQPPAQLLQQLDLIAAAIRATATTRDEPAIASR